MSRFSDGTRRMQEKMAAAAVAYANPDRDIFFVSSTNGNDGNNGDSPRHALATLARAVALASAGDTIVCEPGGSETLTATISVAVDHLNIVCPIVNPNAGYTLTGAGTVDLMTVSGADDRIEGLRFARAAGAGSTTAGLLTTAAADRLAVVNCMFDCSDSTSSWTNYGIELTDDIQHTLIKGCQFRDCHRGVLFATGTGKDQVGARIVDCEFWVGRATAFGLYALAAGTGTNTGLIVKDNLFFELNGSGAAATDAWDGTDGTNGASGPLYFGAATDQFIAANNRCSGASYTFDQRATIISGATGTLADNKSGLDDTAGISSVGTLVSTASSKVTSVGTLVSTADSKVVVVSTAVSTADSKVASVGTLVSTADSKVVVNSTAISTVSTAVSTVGSKATGNSTAISTADSKVASVGTLVSTADSKVVVVSTAVSTADSKVASVATLVGTNSTAVSTADSKVASVGTLVSTADSKVVVVSTAVSTADSKVASVATLIGTNSTAVSTADSKVASVGTLVSTADSKVVVVSTAVSTADSKVASVATLIGTNSTAVSTADSKVASVGTLVSTADSKVVVVSTAVSTVSSVASVVNAWDVRTVKKADLTLHNGAVEDVFTVANGPVEVLGLFMHVTEAVSADACSAHFESDPTSGAGNTPMCGDVSIISAAIGDVFAAVGAGASAMVKYANAVAVGLFPTSSQFVLPGGIDYVPTNGDPTSGIADVYLVYRPLVSTAAVTAS